MQPRLLLLIFLFVWPLAKPHAQDSATALADEEDARATTVEARKHALSALLEASQQLLNAGQKPEAARALNRAGRFQLQLSMPDEAIITFRNTLAILQQTFNSPIRIDAFNGLAKAYNKLGKCNNTKLLVNNVRTLSDQIDYRAGKAEALLILSDCQNFGDHSLALRTAKESLELWRSIDNKRGMARTLVALGYYQMAQNLLVQSTESFEMALKLWRELKVPHEEAEALINLGFLEYRYGLWQASLSFYTQAQALIDEEAEPYMMGQILAGLAEAFIESGLPEIGLDRYRESLEFYRLARDSQAEFSIEWGIGRTHYLLGHYSEALAILNATRSKAESIGEFTLMAHCDDFLGRTYYAMNDTAAALDHFQAALERFTEAKNAMEAARTRALMGQIYERQGNLRKAMERYQTALAAFRNLSDQVNESATLYALGTLELKQGNVNAAEKYLHESIQVTEKMRRVSTSVDLTAAFSARVHERYEKYIDCLMRKYSESPSLSLAVQAFETSELVRARSLTELLHATQTNLFPGLDPQLGLQEKQLRQSLQINENARVTLLSGKYKKQQLETLEQKHRELETQYQTTIGTIRALNPNYERVIRPRAWALRQIQEQVVADDQTVLLEFSLGSEKSYAWVVTRSNLKSFELASKNSINEAATKVYDLLALEPGAETEKKLLEASRELSQLVLSPLAAELNKPRVIIVADGILNYIPFQILPLPSTNDEILVARHEIINAPSASTLGELQIEASQRQPATKVLAAFGDPKFSENVQRTEPNSSGVPLVAANTEQDTRWRSALRDIELNRDSFDPSVVRELFYAKRELDNLRDVVAGEDALVVSQYDATRERFLGADLTQYAMLHFATHGYLDPKRPENSGFVLSTVDRDGKKLDGFVGLREIYELRAPVALVVLSACQTALGKDVRGEGLVGLTRGFMYAGASSVVASLWKVDDEATAELMKLFYTNLLQRGMKPAAALQAAQNSIRSEPRWRSPHYWAGFTLQGQHREVIKTRLATTSLAWMWILIPGIGLLTVVVGLTLWYRRRRLSTGPKKI